MPQLDTTTFLSQIFFTFLGFFIIYIILNRWVIPFLNLALKLRFKLVLKNLICIQQLNFTYYLINFIIIMKFNKIRLSNLSSLTDCYLINHYNDIV